MNAPQAASDTSPRLRRLLGFIEHDPQNLPLIADTAETALDEGQPQTARALIARYEAVAPLPAPMRNLKGLAALGEQDFAQAAAIFEPLVAERPGDPALGFNLAWAKAMLADYAGALDLLDEATAASSARAACLKVQMLHHLGRLDEALACGGELAERFPHDAALMGDLSTAALDAEDAELARFYALRAGDRTEGLATLGMLVLAEDEVEGAARFFDQALGQSPDNARALVGKGLTLMAAGEVGPAAALLDKGAAGFGRHLGTWVAAGWAYYVQGDLATSRARFEKALALDDTFAETHGALAVLDISENDIESAKPRIKVALRLDPQCFAAALAKSMLLSAQGDKTAAERVSYRALNTPVVEGGRTLAQAMAGLGRIGRSGPGEA